MSGIAAVRKDFESMPKRGFVDLAKDSDPPEFSDPEIEMPEETEPRPPPVRRVRQKTGVYEGREEPSGSHEPDVPPGLDEPFSAPAAEPMEVEEDAPPQDAIPAPEPATDGLDLEGAVIGAQENKRELDVAPEPPGKKKQNRIP